MSTVLPTTTTTTTTTTAQNATRNRRVFAFGNLYRFRFNSNARLMDTILDLVNDCLEKVVYVIGPMLILLALGITALLVHTFATILVPMMRLKYATSGSYIIYLHMIWVAFVVYNVLFNYALCVVTRNNGSKYDKLVREMACAANVLYPETPAQVNSYKDDFEYKMIVRIRRRREQQEAAEQNDNDNTSTTNQRKKPSPPIRSWMLMGPYEWGFCSNSNQPKPPRSHYDHVTKALVLNLDHYCPWMFNAIGYFNYRYFVNFMLYVLAGMIYGAYISCESFLLINTDEYRAFVRKERMLESRLERPKPMMPYREEKLEISLAFMMCLAVGIALVFLGGFHVYLTLTAQTTIEFHGNWTSRRRMRKLGKKFTNPYDQGYRKNWQQIYGASSYCWLTSMLPSRREPEFLPVPVPGKNNRRIVDRKGHESDAEDIEQQSLLRERITI